MPEYTCPLSCSWNSELKARLAFPAFGKLEIALFPSCPLSLQMAFSFTSMLFSLGNPFFLSFIWLGSPLQHFQSMSSGSCDVCTRLNAHMQAHTCTSKHMELTALVQLSTSPCCGLHFGTTGTGALQCGSNELFQTCFVFCLQRRCGRNTRDTWS